MAVSWERKSVSITQDIQSTLQYGKDVVYAAARGGLDALPEKGERLEIDARSMGIGAGVGAAVGVCCVAMTQRRKSPWTMLLGGVIGATIAASFVMAWQNRSLAERVVRGGIEGSRPVRDARWLENNPIDYA